MADMKCILAEQGGKGGGSSVQVSKITVKTPPTKTSYLAGETFNPAGINVEAEYTLDGIPFQTGDVTANCSYSPSPLTDGTTVVTVSYTDGSGVTVTTTTPVTVTHRLAAINVTTNPTKTSYVYKESLVTAGIVVTARYSDGATANVSSSCSYSPTGAFTTIGTQTITVSYTENGVTETTTFTVDVGKASYTLAALTANMNASNKSNLQVTIPVPADWNGSITATPASGAPLTATGDGANKRVTLVGQGDTEGTFSVTVNVAEDAHYLAQSTTISVTIKYWSFGSGVDNVGTDGETADLAWWQGLQDHLKTNPSTMVLEKYLGKTKTITLSSAVLGTTTHKVMCIGYNCDKTSDRSTTLTWQTANCLAQTTYFPNSSGSSANMTWNNSYVRNTHCKNYYNALPFKSLVLTVSKGTATTTNSSQAGTPSYTDENVFLPSDCEMGFSKGANNGSCLGYAASYDEFCQLNTAKTKYQWYNVDTATAKTRRIKKLGDSGNAQWYWERSLGYNNASRACRVNSDGTPGTDYYSISSGLAPAFAV